VGHGVMSSSSPRRGSVAGPLHKSDDRTQLLASFFSSLTQQLTPADPPSSSPRSPPPASPCHPTPSRTLLPPPYSFPLIVMVKAKVVARHPMVLRSMPMVLRSKRIVHKAIDVLPAAPKVPPHLCPEPLPPSPALAGVPWPSPIASPPSQTLTHHDVLGPAANPPAGSGPIAPPPPLTPTPRDVPRPAANPPAGSGAVVVWSDVDCLPSPVVFDRDGLVVLWERVDAHTEHQ